MKEKIYCKNCRFFKKEKNTYFYCDLQLPKKVKYINKYTELPEEEIDIEWYESCNKNIARERPQRLNRKNDCPYFVEFY